MDEQKRTRIVQRAKAAHGNLLRIAEYSRETNLVGAHHLKVAADELALWLAANQFGHRVDL